MRKVTFFISLLVLIPLNLCSVSYCATLRGYDGLFGLDSVTFSPDGQLLAGVLYDDSIKLWDPKTGELLKTLTGHKGEFSAVVFSPDGQLLASGGYDTTLWDPKTGELLKTLTAPEHSFNSVVFSPDGQLLASADFQRSFILLWNLNTGARLNFRADDVCFSPDGQLCIIRDNSINLFNLGELGYWFRLWGIDE